VRACVCVCGGGVSVMCILYFDGGFSYPDWRFSVLFPQLWGKCQDKTRKDGTRSAFFQISCYLCCSVVICVVLCIVLCKCVLYCCHQVTTQVQSTNIYHIILYHIISYRIVSYHITTYHISCHVITYHITYIIRKNVSDCYKAK